MRVIGIDPGLNNIGWAILEQISNSIVYIASGKLVTKSCETKSQRLGFISVEIEKIITEYGPLLAAVEETFINVNAQSSISLSQARGAILSSIGRLSIDLIELAPNKIKKTIVGNGRAEKEQVQKMLKLVIPKVTFNSSDEADAIAIAYCALVSYKQY